MKEAADQPLGFSTAPFSIWLQLRRQDGLFCAKLDGLGWAAVIYSSLKLLKDNAQIVSTRLASYLNLGFTPRFGVLKLRLEQVVQILLRQVHVAQFGKA